MKCDQLWSQHVTKLNRQTDVQYVLLQEEGHLLLLGLSDIMSIIQNQALVAKLYMDSDDKQH